MPSSASFLVLTGPTGVGKTSLLLGLRELIGIPIEVISADAYQVYRGLDIGTAKPDQQLLSQIPHHLIDIRNPDQQFSVADFVSEAKRIVAEILARSALPVVCGGTVYYLKHLLFGMPEAPPSDPSIRARLQAQFEINGHIQLHEQLQSVDPESANRIHPNDSYRVLRALEVWQASSRPLSSFRRESPVSDPAGVVIALERPRFELHQLIETRVDRMMDLGLRTEWEGLVAKGYTESSPGMKAIGYQEFFQAHADAAVAEFIKIHTRQYAKRQTTFLRSLPTVHWIAMDDSLRADTQMRSLLRQSFPKLLT